MFDFISRLASNDIFLYAAIGISVVNAIAAVIVSNRERNKIKNKVAELRRKQELSDGDEIIEDPQNKGIEMPEADLDRKDQ